MSLNRNVIFSNQTDVAQAFGAKEIEENVCEMLWKLIKLELELCFHCDKRNLNYTYFLIVIFLVTKMKLGG